MKIVKELNLNKTPQDAKPCSMVYAKNIRLTVDKTALTSEEGLKECIASAEQFGYIAKVYGILSGLDTLVIFAKTKVGNNYKIYTGTIPDIEVAKKTYNITLTECQTKWVLESGEDAEVFGVVTKNNKGELVVAISERGGTGDVPFKVINLSANQTDNSTEISPEVPFANLKFKEDTTGGVIPTGLYYFFIRFELDNKVWSKWQPLGYPKLAKNITYKNIINHTYNKSTFLDSKNYTAEQVNELNTTSLETVSVGVNMAYNDLRFDSSTQFNFIIYLYNYNIAKNAQIGYILQHENGSFGRIWTEFPINNESEHNFHFDAKYIKEISIDDLLKNAYSVHNVKHIVEYQNRLYISNFEEDDYNIKGIDDITCSVSFGVKDNNRKIDVGFNTLVPKNVGDNVILTTNIVTNNILVNTSDFKLKDNINNNYVYLKYDDTIINSTIRSFGSILDNNKIYYSNKPNDIKNVYDLIRHCYLYKYNVDYLDKENLIGFDVFIYKTTDHSDGKYITGYIKIRDLYYWIENNAQSEQGPVYNFKLFANLENIIYTDIIPNGYEINRGGTITVDNKDYYCILSSSSIIPSTGFVTDLCIITAEDFGIVSPLQGKGIIKYNDFSILQLTDGTREITYKEKLGFGNSLDVKTVRSFLPNNVYRFFIHFVRKDGSFTNGILIKHTNGDSTFTSSGLTDYDSSAEDEINRRNYIYPITVSFSDIEIPKPYVGFFITYQTYIDRFGYTAYVHKASLSQEAINNRLSLLRAIDVETHIASHKGNKIDYLFDNTKAISGSCSILENVFVTGESVGDDSTSINTQGSNCGVSIQTDANLYKGSTIIVYNNNNNENPDGQLERLTDIIYCSETQYQTCNETNMDFNYPGFVTIQHFVEFLRPVFISDSGEVYDITKNGVQKTIITSNDDPYIQYNYVIGYSRYDLSAVSIKVEPPVLVSVINTTNSSNKVEGYLETVEKAIMTYLINNGISNSGGVSAIKDILHSALYSGDSKSVIHAKKVSLVLKPIDIANLFEYKNDYIDKQYKQYLKNTPSKVKDYSAVNIIRRSNVMANESVDLGWNEFESDNYYVLTKAKGEITNLVVLHNQLIVHTEHSMFVFDGNNTIKSNESEIQITSADIFDMVPYEIFADNHGYGGLKHKKLSTVNYSGYWFVDSDTKKLFCYNGKIADLTYNLCNFLNNYSIAGGCIASDTVNDRILVCLKLTKGDVDDNENIIYPYVTFSVDIVNSKLISLHDYKFDNAVNLKHRCFISFGDIVDQETKGIYTFTPVVDYGAYNKLMNLDDNIFYTLRDSGDNRSLSIVDIIFNHNYEQPKFLNAIRWIVDKLDIYSGESNNKLAEYPGENQTIDIVDIVKYAGYKLRIYTDSTDSGDINLKSNYPVINKLDDYKHPYYDKGVWTFNYFRNYLNDISENTDTGKWYDLIKDTELCKYIPISSETGKYKKYEDLTQAELNKLLQIKQGLSFSDNRSLIYGKYFVVRFIFDMGTDKKPFKLENVDVNTSIA